MQEKATTQKTRKEVACVVTSAKMNQSRVATIERLVPHGRYGKYVRRTTKLMFHDANNETQEGDRVLVTQCRPMSARKRFTLVKIVEKRRE